MLKCGLLDLLESLLASSLDSENKPKAADQTQPDKPPSEVDAID